MPGTMTRMQILTAVKASAWHVVRKVTRQAPLPAHVLQRCVRQLLRGMSGLTRHLLTASALTQERSQLRRRCGTASVRQVRVQIHLRLKRRQGRVVRNEFLHGSCKHQMYCSMCSCLQAHALQLDKCFQGIWLGLTYVLFRCW